MPTPPHALACDPSPAPHRRVEDRGTQRRWDAESESTVTSVHALGSFCAGRSIGTAIFARPRTAGFRCAEWRWPSSPGEDSQAGEANTTNSAKAVEMNDGSMCESHVVLASSVPLTGRPRVDECSEVVRLSAVKQNLPRFYQLLAPKHPSFRTNFVRRPCRVEVAALLRHVRFFNLI